MRIEDKMSKLMCQTGACSLVLGILSVISGLVLGIIGIVNGARLLRHHSDLMSKNRFSIEYCYLHRGCQDLAAVV